MRIATKFVFFALTTVMLMLSCTTDEKIIVNYGIQSDFRGYIPAQIAVLPCRVWPSLATFAHFHATQVERKDAELICQEIDAFIIKGFSNQPFMQGYAPNLVLKKLKEQNRITSLQQLDKLWALGSTPCTHCKHSLAFYQSVVAPRNDWSIWLQNLSRLTDSSDALLLPFIEYAVEKQETNRGLLLSTRKLAMSLFLIDTNNGKVIWASHRHSEKQAKSFDTYPDYPKWSLALKNLLHSSVWLEFPGRLSY